MNDGTRDFILGQLDAFDRVALYLTASNSADPNGAAYDGNGPILLLGSSTADGASFNTISEGIVVYAEGSVTGLPMNHSDWSYARIKSGRFALLDAQGGVQNEFFRVDDNSFDWRAATQASSLTQFSIRSGYAEFGSALGIGVRSANGGGVFQRKILQTYDDDINGTFTTDDVLGSVVSFTNFSSLHEWTFPSGASLETALPFSSATNLEWCFLIDNQSGDTLFLTPSSSGITVVGRLNGNTTGIIPDNSYAQACFHQTAASTFRVYLFISVY